MEVLSLDCSKLQRSEDHQKILNNETIMYTENKGVTYTVDDAVDRAGYGKFQLRVTCLAGLGWVADAFEIIILSLIGDFVACDWTLRRWQNALLTSVVFAGMMVGAPIFGAVADIYGRKKSLAISMVFLSLFGALTAASPSFVWMVLLRSCMGFALGGVAQGLTLCSEYFPSNVRGKAGFYLSYFWSLGTIGVILLTWVIMEYFNSWRILLVATAMPALLVVLTLKWYPESARYFLVSSQHDRALEVLEQMAAMNDKDLPPGKLVQVSACTKRGRIQDLLKKDFRRTTLLFWYIWLAVAFAYYAVALITPIIVQQGALIADEPQRNGTAESFSDDMRQLITCTKFTQKNYVDLLWTSAAEFPGLIVFTFLIEHCNRKVLLSSACTVTAVLIFLLLIRTEYHVILLLLLFGTRAIIVAVFQLIFVMTSEAFPTTHRAIAMGSGSSFCRLGGLMVPYVAQVLVIQNPVAAICLLGSIVLLAAVAAALLPLERRGQHMQEWQSSKG